MCIFKILKRGVSYFVNNCFIYDQSFVTTKTLWWVWFILVFHSHLHWHYTFVKRLGEKRLWSQYIKQTGPMWHINSVINVPVQSHDVRSTSPAWILVERNQFILRSLYVQCYIRGPSRIRILIDEIAGVCKMSVTVQTKNLIVSHHNSARISFVTKR